MSIQFAFELVFHAMYLCNQINDTQAVYSLNIMWHSMNGLISSRMHLFLHPLPLFFLIFVVSHVVDFLRFLVLVLVFLVLVLVFLVLVLVLVLILLFSSSSSWSCSSSSFAAAAAVVIFCCCCGSSSSSSTSSPPHPPPHSLWLTVLFLVSQLYNIG